RARLGLLGGLKSIADGVPVGLVERVEERLRLLVLRERSQKIRGHFRLARRVVGQVPATVSLGGFDLREPARLHPPFAREPLDVLAVALGPTTARPARREAADPGLVVERLHLTVDPAPAQRLIERLVVGHGGDAAALLEEPDPEAGRARVVLLEPR